MKHTPRLLAVAAFVALPACVSAAGTDSQTPSQTTEIVTEDSPSAAETPTTESQTASPPTDQDTDNGEEKATTHTCAEGTFVACHDGKDCTRKHGAFITPKTCFDTAAAACDAASCQHGCNLYGTQIGGPKLALCATNAATSGHMKVCGGIANWRCPENMRCDLPKTKRRASDASGTCVADKSSSK